jgi:hypothetical protein
MKKDFRTLSDAPFCVDWRGHETLWDGYAAVDFSGIDAIVDMQFLHTAFALNDYENQPAQEKEVLRSLTWSTLAHMYVNDNTTKPILNPEAIYGEVNQPRSRDFSSANRFDLRPFDIAKLVRKPIHFRFDPDNRGVKEKWFVPSYNCSQWNTVDLSYWGLASTGNWNSGKQLSGQTGMGWYRTEFSLPGEVVQACRDGSRRLLLAGSGIGGEGTVWINGKEVGYSWAGQVSTMNRPLQQLAATTTTREGATMIRTQYRKPGTAKARYVRKATGQDFYKWCEQSAEDSRYDLHR